MRQDAVFTGHGHKVRGDRYHLQVQQGFQDCGIKLVLLDISLNQFEAYAAAAKVVEGIVAVLALGVQDSHGAWKFVLREVVVADYDFYALSPCILHLVDGFDSAVQGNDKVYVIVRCPVKGFIGEAVALVVSVRDIERNLLGESFDEGIDLRHSGGAVYIIVPVNKNLFPFRDCLMEPFHGLVHVFHQEWVVKVFQAGTEETAGILKGLYAALDQEFRKDSVDAQLRGKLRHFFRCRRILQRPFFVRNAHSLTNIAKNIKTA